MPTTAGRTACHTSTNGWPVTSTCGPATAAAIRLSFEPGTRWSTSTPSRRRSPGRTRPPPRPARRCRTAARRPRRRPGGRGPRPAPPARRRAGPRPRSGSAGRFLPPRCRAGSSPTPTARRPDRRPTDGARRLDERGQPAVEQEARRAHREDPPAAVAVLQRHPVGLHLDDRPAELRCRVLDDQTQLGGHFRQVRSARPAPAIGGEHVAVVMSPDDRHVIERIGVSPAWPQCHAGRSWLAWRPCPVPPRR